ncbi:MAG: abscisic acid-deficient protein Aba4 family protein [Oleiphilaceae bacterium]|nr:abscisic acid-deficient protein Aba4 family protein [Oleiphilaceae bacterium]
MIDTQLAFLALNISVLPLWLLLIVAPQWRWTHRLVHRIWLPGLLCVLWGGILLLMPPLPEGAGVASLAQFMVFMTSPAGALLVWLQLLMWDLFVGAWVARDALRRRLHHGLVAPSLVLVLLLPPLGLLVYFGVRSLRTGVTSLWEAPSW